MKVVNEQHSGCGNTENVTCGREVIKCLEGTIEHFWCNLACSMCMTAVNSLA